MEPPSALDELYFTPATGLVIYGLTSLALLLDSELLERRRLYCRHFCICSARPCRATMSGGSGPPVARKHSVDHAVNDGLGIVQHCCSVHMADSQYLFAEQPIERTDGWKHHMKSKNEPVCVKMTVASSLSTNVISIINKKSRPRRCASESRVPRLCRSALVLWRGVLSLLTPLVRTNKPMKQSCWLLRC